jgi:trehalose/maltose hydrolase-like predicted phosphorylase
VREIIGSLAVFVLGATLTSAASAFGPTRSERSSEARVDTWKIDADRIDLKNYHGVALANGMIGLMSSPVPFATKQTLIYGAYETIAPNYVTCIVSAIDMLNLGFSIDGERIDELSDVQNFRQQLDMQNAVLSTSFDFRDKASVTYKQRALRHMPHSALLEVIIQAKQPLTFTASSWLGSAYPPAIGSMPGPLKADDQMVPWGKEQTPAIRLKAAHGTTRFGSLKLGAAQGFMFDEPIASSPEVLSESNGLKFRRQLRTRERYRFALVGSTTTSAHMQDPFSQAKRMTANAVLQGISDLIVKHEAAWAELWKGNVVIEGDAETQRDVNSMLFHLYSSVREDTTYSIPPMGLSDGITGYLGHVFWDADIWMMPALLAFHPELARSIVEYRYERLPAAKRRAAALGYKGALFPWESAATGDEETPSADLTGIIQHHVSADVAIAAWNYYRVTQDREWLREKGYPLLKETADFWASRVQRNGPGRYDINNVIPPDEYARNVNNSAFTNAAARENLAFATKAANLLGIAPTPDWEHVRQNIPILRFPDGVIREHATYNGEPTKIADVNLLAYPLEFVTDTTQTRSDLEYYVQRKDPVMGPTMGQAIFAILYQRLGMPQEAYKMFRDGYKPNERPPFGVIAEHAVGEHPYFVTGAGGLMQTVLYGFGGLRITDQGIVHESTGKLPAGWKSITLTGVGPRRETFVVK